MSKYLFFDVDGTLRGKSRLLHPKTREALIRLQEQGHKLFICSGRSPASLKGPVMKAVDFDGMIACAGGCILVDGQCIYQHDIEIPLLRKVIENFREKNILYCLETREALYQSEALTNHRQWNRQVRYGNRPEVMKVFEEEIRETVCRPLEDFDDTRIGVPKLSFVSYEPAEFERMRPMLEKDFHIIIYIEDENLLDGELIPRAWTKADGIQKVLEYYHAGWEDTIGFGDSMNDYQMLRAVHIGVAYENGPEELKKQAKYFFKNPDEAGIYLALVDMGLVGS